MDNCAHARLLYLSRLRNTLNPIAVLCGSGLPVSLRGLRHALDLTPRKKRKLLERQVTPIPEASEPSPNSHEKPRVTGSPIRVATDVGGTFTDLVAFEPDSPGGGTAVRVAKTDTTAPK